MPGHCCAAVLMWSSGYWALVAVHSCCFLCCCKEWIFNLPQFLIPHLRELWCCLSQWWLLHSHVPGLAAVDATADSGFPDWPWIQAWPQNWNYSSVLEVELLLKMRRRLEKFEILLRANQTSDGGRLKVDSNCIWLLRCLLSVRELNTVITQHIDRQWISGLVLALNSWRKRPWTLLNSICRNLIVVNSLVNLVTEYWQNCKSHKLSYYITVLWELLVMDWYLWFDIPAHIRMKIW